MKADTRTLTNSDIREIDVSAEVQDLIDQLNVDIEHIKAQLEFGTDDDSVEWEGRALHALAHRRAQRACAIRHLEALTKPPAIEAAPTDHAAKERVLRLKEEIAERGRVHNIEVQRLAVEKERLKREHLMCVDGHFARLARRYLTVEQRIECDAQAAILAGVAK